MYPVRVVCIIKECNWRKSVEFNSVTMPPGTKHISVTCPTHLKMTKPDTNIFFGEYNKQLATKIYNVEFNNLIQSKECPRRCGEMVAENYILYCRNCKFKYLMDKIVTL